MKTKLAHYVALEAFEKRGNAARPALDALAPVPLARVKAEGRHRVDEHGARVFALAKEGVSLEESCQEVDAGEIIVLRYYFRKIAHVAAFFRRLRELPDADREDLVENIEERLDEDGNFSFRLDLDELARGRLRLVPRGACVVVRVSVAAYPKTEERAIATLRDALRHLVTTK